MNMNNFFKPSFTLFIPLPPKKLFSKFQNTAYQIHQSLSADFQTCMLLIIIHPLTGASWSPDELTYPRCQGVCVWGGDLTRCITWQNEPLWMFLGSAWAWSSQSTPSHSTSSFHVSTLATTFPYRDLEDSFRQSVVQEDMAKPDQIVPLCYYEKGFLMLHEAGDHALYKIVGLVSL